jgi:hypothetical protein
MMHCWALLQHNEKWNKRYADEQPTKHSGLPDLNSATWQDDDDGASTTSEKKLKVQEEEAAAKKMEQESKIMFQDLNGLNETQRAYFQVMRAEIMASSTRGPSGSSSSIG